MSRPPYTPSRYCPICGALVTGNPSHECGQAYAPVDRTTFDQTKEPTDGRDAKA